jgi:hypothetical protein
MQKDRIRLNVDIDSFCGIKPCLSGTIEFQLADERSSIEALFGSSAS